MEEGTELLHRLGDLLAGKEVTIPMTTSCCPGWVTFMEKHYPELLPHLSTAKSPMQMFGAIAKNYFAPKIEKERKDLFVVAVMPCTAKKYEHSREEFGKNGDQDVNAVITTRELAHLIRFANIDFATLEDSDFDAPLGESSGAAVIFGATGGVLEAAVRSAYELHTKKTLPRIDFQELRGFKAIRTATIDFDGVAVNVAVAHGLANARQLVEEMKTGKSPYHFIEVMACPGGCIGGGGQPYHRGDIMLLRERMDSIYKEDAEKAIRKSHENPFIQKLYKEYLGTPGDHLSHELLHTAYYDRKPVACPSENCKNK
jgi:NADP-reducing hydrogenase subunit HndD